MPDAVEAGEVDGRPRDEDEQQDGEEFLYLGHERGVTEEGRQDARDEQQAAADDARGYLVAYIPEAARDRRDGQHPGVHVQHVGADEADRHDRQDPDAADRLDGDRDVRAGDRQQAADVAAEDAQEDGGNGVAEHDRQNGPRARTFFGR